MVTITYNKKRLKINVKRIFYGILILALSVGFLHILVDFTRFPEKYLTTWKYQLENDILQGDTEAMEYYQNTYVDNGIFLYGEDERTENDYINLATVTGFDATESGVLLYTEDGNGYYIEK